MGMQTLRMESNTNRWPSLRPHATTTVAKIFTNISPLLVLVSMVALMPTAWALPVTFSIADPETDSLRLAARRPNILPRAKINDPTQNITRNPEIDCGFDGDEDMYGLGIRIGYYIQWVATVFGAYYTPQVVSSAFEGNAIFNIGMLAGLVYSTMIREDMFVVEPIMVLGFSIGGAIVGLLDPKNVHHPKDLKSLRARLVHLCGTGALSLPLLIYWMWYSFYGMDTLAYNKCSRYAFFIVKIDIWSPWFRYFMKVATILSLVGLFVLAVGVVLAYRNKSNELPQHPQARLARANRLSSTEVALMLRARPTKTQFFVVIIICAICALSVELGIIWNNISGVNALGSTGQLIPMAIGIITSVRVCLGVIKKMFKSRKQRRKEREHERSGFMGPAEVIETRKSMSIRRQSIIDYQGNGRDRDDEKDGDGSRGESGALNDSDTDKISMQRARRSESSVTLSVETTHSPGYENRQSREIGTSRHASTTGSMRSMRSGKLTKSRVELLGPTTRPESTSTMGSALMMPQAPLPVLTRTMTLRSNNTSATVPTSPIGEPGPVHSGRKGKLQKPQQQGGKKE
ncbi:hypothetical protein BDZ91DRAFT_718709 [Kalaharituber pfeilii]|nr:hypothetical protein BDZ91DRAFT_718709 [Kalaharituber pfeilii]